MANLELLRKVLNHAKANPNFNMRDVNNCFINSFKTVQDVHYSKIINHYGMDAEYYLAITIPRFSNANFQIEDVNDPAYITNKQAFTMFENWLIALENDPLAVPDWDVLK